MTKWDILTDNLVKFAKSHKTFFHSHMGRVIMVTTRGFDTSLPDGPGGVKEMIPHSRAEIVVSIDTPGIDWPSVTNIGPFSHELSAYAFAARTFEEYKRDLLIWRDRHNEIRQGKTSPSH